MHSLSDVFPLRPRGAGAEARLVDAYKATFTGRASAEDCDLVLSDLATATRYFRILGAPVSPDERAFHDGQRWVMERILSFLERDGKDLLDLRAAASREHQVDFPVSRSEAPDLDDYA